jgi:uncharacterized protein YjiS (DUF1127 family)
MNSVQCIGTYRPSRKSRRTPKNQRRDGVAAIRNGLEAAQRLVSVWCRRVGLRRALRVYPDSMLAGFGLTREQAAAEAAKPFWAA